MELLIFNNITNDPVLRGIENHDRISVMRNIISFSEQSGVTDEPVKEYVISLMAQDDNILSYLAQSGRKIGHDLKNKAIKDTEDILSLISGYHLSYSNSGNEPGFYKGYTQSVKLLVKAKSPRELLEGLIDHYRALGSGITAKYTAFKYDGVLAGISNTEKITFDSLIGLEHQKRILKENTEAFLNGKTANNVLLYGDRGSGKSSSVKALLNMYQDKGLRIIEIPKAYIEHIPALTKMLSDKPHKYILFLDDLSFEAHDAQYSALKIVMEGQLQAGRGNMLIYATSNRRHLIKENWADRDGSEVHKNDHMQETLSLSERFGISLVFSSPNQKEYLNIVSGLLDTYGVRMTPEIEKEAVMWQMRYGGRSARCAKQFVASYVSKL